ncbi:MAG: putative NAD/FAD-binding protein [Phycisphaerales bacterium]|jgi:predicted NAD/FAD-binding protein
MATNEEQLNIAVIGAGIAGITSAYLLAKKHKVTLLERNGYVGGHTNTIPVAEDGRVLPVDTGFIVCNPKTYPTFYRLLAQWGVPLRDSDMSFGFSCDKTSVGYAGPEIREFLRKPSNLLNPRLLGMIRTQRRFNRRAAADLESGMLAGLSLGEYLQKIGVSSFFIEHYLVPLAAAVWSSPDADIDRFPAETFIRFFANHGLLDLRDRPTWQTVVGGSSAYIKAFRAQFRGRVFTDSPVQSVDRDADGVSVTLGNRDTTRYDHVVLATHADESLSLLADPTDAERSALSSWSYQDNHVQLHTDPAVMPPDQRLWASWNYRRHSKTDVAAPVNITYYMNRLQGLQSANNYFVSLNSKRLVDPDKVIYSVDYTHPAYTSRSIDAQKRLRSMNGTHNTWFCGAYMRYGFHEDAVVSAADVAGHFGITI